MTVNFTLLAQNNGTDYVRQACVCAMSIKSSTPNSKICLITNDIVPVKYTSLFDSIVEIPWDDNASESDWKIENRWKIIYATPYDNSIVLDVDTLVLDDLTKAWNSLQTYNLYFLTNPKTYRGIDFTSDYYRKLFTSNNLPNIYSGFHYFNKSSESFEFYKMLEYIIKNWKHYHSILADNHKQQRCSIDVSAAMASLFLDCENQITSRDKIVDFVHMKSHGQNRKSIKTDNWCNVVNCYLTNEHQLFVGNYRQYGVFHYTQDEFLTEEIINVYEKTLGINK